MAACCGTGAGRFWRYHGKEETTVVSCSAEAGDSLISVGIAKSGSEAVAGLWASAFWRRVVVKERLNNAGVADDREMAYLLHDRQQARPEIIARVIFVMVCNDRICQWFIETWKDGETRRRVSNYPNFWSASESSDVTLAPPAAAGLST